MAVLRDDGAGLDKMDWGNDGGDYHHRNTNNAGARRSDGDEGDLAADDRPD